MTVAVQGVVYGLSIAQDERRNRWDGLKERLCLVGIVRILSGVPNSWLFGTVPVR